MSLFDLIGFSTLYNSNRYLLRDAGGPLRATFHMKCVDKKLFKVKKKKKKNYTFLQIYIFPTTRELTIYIEIEIVKGKTVCRTEGKKK